MSGDAINAMALERIAAACERVVEAVERAVELQAVTIAEVGELKKNYAHLYASVGDICSAIGALTKASAP